MPTPAAWPRASIRAGVGAVALASLSVWVAPRDPGAWETDVVDFATRTPAVIGAPARLIMQLGAKPAIFLVAAVVLAVTRSRKAAAAVLVAGLIAVLTNPLLKEWVSRPRPDGVRLRETIDGFGFPSGHTCLAWTLAAASAAYLPGRWRWLPFALAATVGWARMYVGVHFPLDVLGGALWGLCIGWAITALPWFEPDQREGPSAMGM